jgi:hypothetical protein
MKKLLLSLALVAISSAAYAQGTVGFANGTLTRFKLIPTPTGTAANGVDVPVGTAINYGLFWGPTATSLSPTPVLPLGAQSSTAGILTVASGGAYQIPATEPGQVVFLQVRGWSASFGNDWRAAQGAFDLGQAGTMFGQTAVIQLASTGLGASTGPGAVIWQGAAGTNPNRFNPLLVFTAVPEPSTIALGVLGLGSLLFLRRRQAK